jgi:hypothetical protein
MRRYFITAVPYIRPQMKPTFYPPEIRKKELTKMEQGILNLV